MRLEYMRRRGKKVDHPQLEYMYIGRRSFSMGTRNELIPSSKKLTSCRTNVVTLHAHLINVGDRDRAEISPAQELAQLTVVVGDLQRRTYMSMCMHKNTPCACTCHGIRACMFTLYVANFGSGAYTYA